MMTANQLRIAAASIGTVLGSYSAAHAQTVVYEFVGDAPGDSMGGRVARAGDVNADGVSDVMAAAQDDEQGLNAGVVRVFSGADGSVLYNWRGLEAGAGASFGTTIAGAGDVDADGYADLIVGVAYTSSGSTAGSARVYSGFDGQLLFVFDGVTPSDGFHVVGGAGDVDADGHADLIVGGSGHPAGGTSAGMVRIFSGSDGSLLHQFTGTAVNESLGHSVCGLGDVNGDGHSDVAAGAPFANTPAGSASGRVTVYSGSDGAVLYTFVGNSTDAFLGQVARAGDVDADGYPDLIVGSPGDDFFGYYTGSARVISGRFGTTIHEWFGSGPNQGFGIRVAGAGDVDGDGHADLGVVFKSDIGLVHVYSGRDGSLLYVLGASTVGEPIHTFDGLDDVNGDGYGDFAGGAQLTPSGTIFVLSGHEHLVAYCFGDAGASCPCLNAGGPAEGCANSSGGGGALGATGSASISDDELTFAATQLLPSQPALLFAGLNSVNGGAGLPFGDGLRCAGGDVQRLGIETPNGAGHAAFGPGLSSRGEWSPGEVRRFQVWYRDPTGPCGFTFNLTNGVEVALSL